LPGDQAVFDGLREFLGLKRGLEPGGADQPVGFVRLSLGNAWDIDAADDGVEESDQRPRAECEAGGQQK
jgi:hypothetical protein